MRIKHNVKTFELLEGLSFGVWEFVVFGTISILYG